MHILFFHMAKGQLQKWMNRIDRNRRSTTFKNSTACVLSQWGNGTRPARIRDKVRTRLASTKNTKFYKQNKSEQNSKIRQHFVSSQCGNGTRPNPIFGTKCAQGSRAHKNTKVDKPSKSKQTKYKIQKFDCILSFHNEETAQGQPVFGTKCAQGSRTQKVSEAS